jgi:hypothetical protein
MNFIELDTKRLRTHHLKLGEQYTIGYNMKGKTVTARFIKVTKTGYNFLNEQKHTCVFSRCIYPIDKCNLNNLQFIIPWHWDIKPLENGV